MPKPSHVRFRFAQFVNGWRALGADRRGTVAVLMGLLMPILVASLGIGFEISSWYMRGRSMQNAADAAATAAASNNGPGYDVEAKAVAAQYGYVHGSNNITVTVSNSAACPAGGSDCYSVTITSIVPLYLAQVLGGFTGDNGSGQKLISSTAIAQNQEIEVPICLLALDQSGGDAVRTNGAPNSDLSGCTVMSNSDSNCNGSDLLAAWGLAAGTNQDCGLNQRNNVDPVPDPWAAMAANIPPDPCGGVYDGRSIDTGAALTAGVKNWPINANPGNFVHFCGNVQLPGDVTVQTPDDQTGATLVIWNGSLDANNHKLMVGANSGMTIVFAGTNSGSYKHIPADKNGPGGVFDISSPKGSSAPFPGMALYQAPNLTQNIDFDFRGNDPQWFLSGGVYLPNANPRVRGSVSPATNGEDCFVLVVNTIRFDGTMNLYQQTPDGSGCNLQGLDQPKATIDDRGHLVF